MKHIFLVLGMTLSAFTYAFATDANSSAPSASAAAGFSGGNDLTAVIISGEISVSCPGNTSGPSFVNVSCTEEILNPSEYAYFLGSKNNGATKVTLRSIWQNGKVRTKNSNYNSELGRSTDNFNLWIETVLQSALLDYGKNTIQYTLSNSAGAAVESGQFIANVSRGEPAECAYGGVYYADNPSDCNADAYLDKYCARYFHAHNYCQ
jgi:hypothetical protein